jgi:hypothetical protein
MAKIDHYVDFVKDQVGVQERLAKKHLEDSYRRGLHLKSANSFSELAKFLETIQSKGTENTSYLNRGDSPLKRILITFEDIDGAPDELLKELNISDTDKQELLIEYIIAQSGGILSLNKIMVELYKRTREIPSRTIVTSRLYRMAGRGMIYNVPGKKGVYSTFELSEQDAKRMFGQSDSEPEDAPAPVPATPAPEPATPAPSVRPKSINQRFLSSTAPARRM